jgi:Uncharacterised BCR, YbaB family COG0718.
MPDHDPLAALEAAKARVHDRLQDARAAASGASRVASGVRDLVRTVESSSHEVSVTARASGEVTRIDVTDAAFGLSASALSTLLTSTVAAAQQAAAQAAVREIAAELGDESPLVAALRGEVARRSWQERS